MGANVSIAWIIGVINCLLMFIVPFVPESARVAESVASLATGFLATEVAAVHVDAEEPWK